MGMIKMNIEITRDLEKFIQNKVKSGLYASPNEVIRESLQLLDIHDEIHKKRLKQLNHAIEAGLTQLSKGQCDKGDVVYRRLKDKIEKSPKQN
jgi:antitoxin ParD1/3/4